MQHIASREEYTLPYSTMNTFAYILLVVCVASNQAQPLNDNSRPIVETKQGKVQGIAEKNVNGKEYFAFRGIPYAKPPVGDLRFKRPEPSEPWQDVRDASKEASVCLQYDLFILKAKTGTEDCLFANVYTPELPKQDGGKAVMVWIHGGGYFIGSGNQMFFGAGKLMDHDVILVTINYRLGPFGFMSTGDEVIPGNFGLWDQTQALKWVQENIQAFGGDKNKVTIFGESAGSSSVSLHVLSKQSKGLFSGAIMQSGVATNPFALQENIRPITDSIASEVNCPNDSSSKMLQCLNSTDANILLNAFLAKAVPDTVFPIMLGPVIESQGQDRFLEDTPVNLLKKKQYNQVPVIAGIMASEALLFIDDMKNASKFSQFDKTFLETKLESLLEVITDFKTNLSEIADRLRKAYFTGVDLGDYSKVSGPLTEMLSDSAFDAGTVQFMKLLAETDPHKAFMYVMTYRGKNSFATILKNRTEELEATHADDTIYLFDVSFIANGTLEGKDKEFSTKLLTLWTNFAKKGVPTPENRDLISVEWKPVTSDKELQYLKIDKDLTMEKNYREDKMKLWNEVLPKIEAGKEIDN